VKIHLIAGPAPGLQHTEKTGSLHIRDGLVGNAAQAPALERALGKRREQSAGARNDLARLRRAGSDLSCLHGHIGH